MKLLINHQTLYSYETPVKNAMQYLRMLPQDTDNQKILHWGISAPGEKIQQLDGFGNQWLTCSQRFEYQQLMIMAQGMVEIDPNAKYAKDDRINPLIYLQQTKQTQCSPEMIQFAHMHSVDTKNEHLIDLAEALLEQIPYVPGQTSVETTAAEAFEQGRGVCQDHAQVFVAMARYLGYPARYVSGYLFVEQGQHLASHAWAEVYIDGHWHSYDVSNQLFTPQCHVQLAVGRDYADVAPIRGVREQGAEEHMETFVQVLAC
ncbi:Transglutaminase-like enzyme, putative cysteine protease [Acinetobacter marinus]|uniref:Transglutaminase-like enzyme, putative cysteine protease n=1 Tax=Acinetobacter marinus TaxID=281375 RepID=A0A1G6JHD1_9GAMM|nr:transglutaminase family protein [Acinetobacter marinus]SDC18097.1 Transglutaminase-like enzyme, putative cysteine protease [Acinetobacter marinus]